MRFLIDAQLPPALAGCIEQADQIATHVIDHAMTEASDATIWGLAFSPGGRSLAAACGDGKVRLWDPITRQVTLVLEGPPSRVNCVAFAPDSLTLASGSHDGSITLWHAGEP